TGKASIPQITYSNDLIYGETIYVSSNGLSVKATCFEPAGHSFHDVALKLVGCFMEEKVEDDDEINDSKASIPQITYSNELIYGETIYVSSNGLPVKATCFEPAGHSFHDVVLKLVGCFMEENVEDDDEINDSLPKDKEPDYMQSDFRIRVSDVKDKMLPRLHVAIIQSWYQREGYVKSMADLIQKELQSFGSPGKVMIIFSAHKVPETYVRDDGKLLADIVSTLAVPRPEAMPIREACHVDVQRIYPGKRRPRKHAQAQQHAKGQGPTPFSLVVPEGKGVSSSASVEVASMQVVAPVHENSVVGAACGVIDQMASACCEADKLLAMVF
nr:DnaJ homolog subfamily C member 2-like [Tanacetum cinerariifolium]